MWERYGFYVVQSLLALYLALHFKWPDDQIYALVGSFTALTYLSPVAGGWIADQLLGQKRTVLIGAICLFLSYLSLTLFNSHLMLVGALAGVAVGTGMLKPNISSLLGNEYPIDSPKRESGFTIFYMGITSGIILGTTLPSLLTHFLGWSFTFFSAALGMIVAFIVFVYGIRRFNLQDYYPFQYHPIKIIKAMVTMLALWITSFVILEYSKIADIALILVALLSLLFFINTIRREQGKQAKQTLVIVLLCIISIMFWAFYFQMFLSWTLFISRVVEPSLLGFNFPPPYYVSIQSLGMIAFGYFLSKHMPPLNSIQRGLRTGNKFVLSMVIMTLAYALVTLVAFKGKNTYLLSPFYVIPAYLFISIAELLLSPVGLSAITLLASRKKVSTMMGIFFVSLGLGGFLSGKLATLTSVKSTDLPIHLMKLHYAETFQELFIILVIATIICFFLNGLIRHLLLSSEK